MKTLGPAWKALRSKPVLLLLILGNLTLGMLAFMQGRVIENQRTLIELLYHDSTELAGYKIIANIAHANKH